MPMSPIVIAKAVEYARKIQQSSLCLKKVHTPVQVYSMHGIINYFINYPVACLKVLISALQRRLRRR